MLPHHMMEQLHVRTQCSLLCASSILKKKKGNLPQTIFGVHGVERSLHSCFGPPPPSLLYCSTAGMQTSKVRSVSITCSCIIPTLCNSLLKKENPSGVPLWLTERHCGQTWKRKKQRPMSRRCRMKDPAPPARHSTQAAATNEQITAFNPPD